MKQGVMPCLTPRDLTTYLGSLVRLCPAGKRKKGGTVIWNRGMQVSILEKGGFVTNLRNLAVLECLSQSAWSRAMNR